MDKEDIKREKFEYFELNENKTMISKVLYDLWGDTSVLREILKLHSNNSNDERWKSIIAFT